MTKKKNNLKENLTATMVGIAAGNAIIGGLATMFGFGNKTSKRDVVKGVLDLVIDDYEKSIDLLNNEIINLETENSKLTNKIKLLEEKAKKKSSKKK